MGDIPLGDIKEAPESGYIGEAKPIEGHSYVMRSQGKYGKIRIEDIFSPEDYDWISVTKYEFEWVYQPDGTRSFGGGEAPTPTPTPTPAGSCDWTGTWQTNWGEMVLSQAGTQVSGSYTHDAGRITGTLSGSTLIGTWSEAPSYSPSNDAGDVQLTIAADCNSFTGIWRYGSSGDWSEGWTGTRTGAVPTPTPTPSPTPAGHKLVAYYPFNGDTTAHSWNGNHGTNHGATFVSGVSGKALEFSGKDDYISTDYTQNSVTAYTIEVWVKTTDSGNKKTFVQDRGSGAGKSLTLGIGQSGGGFGSSGQVFYILDSEGIDTGVHSVQTINDNNWHHVVGVWSASPETEIDPS